MKRYYLLNKTASHGFEELTEEEYITIVGVSPVKEYANKVYREEISITDVPDEYREQTQAVVCAKTDRLGVYHVSDTEALNIITGGDVE